MVVNALAEPYLTLEAACQRFFGGAIKPASLRAEAKRGRLRIFRVGRTDFVEPAAIREMIAWQGQENQPASGSIRRMEGGSSETERRSSELAALRQTSQALKQLSRNTPPANTTQPTASIHHLGSRSDKS